MRASRTMRGRAVFLDKDGTLIDDLPYNVDPLRITLAQGAPEALRHLHAAGYALCVISNQSGVALGYFEEQALAAVSAALHQQLSAAEVPLAGVYYCPHHPEGRVAPYAMACRCRKPRPGLLEKAAEALGIDLAHSWFIGDILHDVEAGHRAGCRAILINNGNETEWDLSSSLRQPDFMAKDLIEAAAHITAAGGSHDA